MIGAQYVLCFFFVFFSCIVIPSNYLQIKHILDWILVACTSETMGHQKESVGNTALGSVINK